VLFKPRGLVAAGTATRWDVSSDGKKFLLPIAVPANAEAPYTIVLNWTSLLKK
jgi:hypothetical protein